jgi:putative sigma-54 modulation protein
MRGRNAVVTEALRRHVEQRFRKVAKQVSDLAVLEVELRAERNPAIADGKLVDAMLHLKGTTLRATERSADLTHSIDLAADNLARQVKRHRDKRRRRRERAAATPPPLQSSESA